MNVKNMVAKIKLHHMKNRLESPTFEFPSALNKPKQILVCLPRGFKELTLVKQFLPPLTELFKPAEITLLSMPGVRVKDIYPRKGFNILSPSPDMVGWAGLPNKQYIRILKDCKIDLVLDLNFGYSNFISGVLLSFPEAIRIGKGNHLGEPYYNLEIKTKYLRDERNIYRSLFEILNTLKGSRN